MCSSGSRAWCSRARWHCDRPRGGGCAHHGRHRGSSSRCVAVCTDVDGHRSSESYATDDFSFGSAQLTLCHRVSIGTTTRMRRTRRRDTARRGGAPSAGDVPCVQWWSDEHCSMNMSMNRTWSMGAVAHGRVCVSQWDWTRAWMRRTRNRNTCTRRT